MSFAVSWALFGVPLVVVVVSWAARFRALEF